MRSSRVLRIRWKEALVFAGKQREIVRSGLSSLILRVAGLVSAFGLGVILARALGPAEYGIYGLVTSVAALAMMVSLLGTPQLAVRELSIRSARGDWAGIKALIKRFGIATSAAALLLGLIAIGLAWAFAPADGSMLLYVALGSLLALLMALTTLVGAELRGLGAMVKGQVMTLTARPAAVFLVALALVLSGVHFGAVEALWITVGITLITAAISLVWIHNMIPADARLLPPVRHISWIGAALPLGAVDVLRQFDGTSGLVLMGWFASAAELGSFRVALSCMVVVGMPISILHIVQAPTLSKLYQFGETEELQSRLSSASALMMVAVAPITILAWLLGESAISLVFGEVYADAWLPLFLLCVAHLVTAFYGMGPILLAMCNGERALIRIYLVSVGVGTVVAVPLIDRFGAMGAAGAQIVSMGLVGLLSARFAKRSLGLDVTFLPLLAQRASRSRRARFD